MITKLIPSEVAALFKKHGKIPYPCSLFYNPYTDYTKPEQATHCCGIGIMIIDGKSLYDFDSRFRTEFQNGFDNGMVTTGGTLLYWVNGRSEAFLDGFETALLATGRDNIHKAFLNLKAEITNVMG